MAISDEEEFDGTRTRSKWSTPVVQKQRLAYMDKLNSKVRSRGFDTTDQFNERYECLAMISSLNHSLL